MSANISFFNADMSYGSLEEAFPEVDPGIRPFGSRVLVQMRRAKGKTKGGILLVADTKDSEIWNGQVGKVIAMGPIAYCDRKTGEPWPEGKWCEVGDYVRTAKFGGDKWQIPLPNGSADDTVLFVMFNDADVLGKVTGDPLSIRVFV